MSRLTFVQSSSNRSVGQIMLIRNTRSPLLDLVNFRDGLVGRVEQLHRPNHRVDNLTYPNTVVPVMNGHPRDHAKVSVHCRWPLVTGTDGQAGDAKYNTPCNTTYYYQHQRYS